MRGDHPHNRLSRGAPVALGGHLVRSLKARWRAYRKGLKRCQKRFSARSVHDLRVETRRLLSTLVLLGALTPKDTLWKTRRTLKKRLDAFDDLRDTQVQLLHLKRVQRKVPVPKVFREQLKRRERRLIKATAKKVNAAGTAKLAKRIGQLRKTVQATFADPNQATRRVAALNRTVQRAFDRVLSFRRRINPARTSTIHRTRIAFKKFRYMMESLQPLLPQVTAARLKAMHDYQVRMGHIQDVEVLLERTDKMVAKKKIKNTAVQPLRRYLTGQRAASVQAYLKSADQLLTFRPRPMTQR